MHDLVSDTPKAVMKKASHEFGRLRLFLLWRHAFEEPFYSHKEFHLLTRLHCSRMLEHGSSG